MATKTSLTYVDYHNYTSFIWIHDHKCIDEVVDLHCSFGRSKSREFELLVRLESLQFYLF